MAVDLEAAAQFIETLAGRKNAGVTFQTFDDRGKDKALARVLNGTLKTFAKTLRELNQQPVGIFLTINETDLTGRKRANILAIRALFIDLDGVDALPEFPLPPSIIVRSGGGWHVYWLIRAGEDIELFEQAQKHLAAFYGSDPKVHDIPRVMRLPGFLWHKEDPPRPVQLVETHPERTYSIVEVLAAHPVAPTPPKIRRLNTEAPSDHPLHERIHRASAYLAKLPAAVSGQNGHGDCWKAALAVVRGFSLPGPVALDLLASEYNVRCSPPWSVSELQHKVGSAINDAKVPIGYLVETRTPRVRRNHHEQTIPSSVTSAPNNSSGPPDRSLDFITDNMVAKQFVGLHANELRYVDVWSKWLVWNGSKWDFDDTRSVEVRARAFAKRLLLNAIDSSDERKLKSALEFQKRPRIEATVSLSRCDPRITRRPSDFDRDPWLFNCANGTIDLRTGMLCPHRQEDHITKASPVAYDSKALCPVFDHFLEDIFPDQLVRAYVKRAVGYSLTASVREQVLFFAHGGGANGKSVLLGIVSHIVGNYGKTAAPELLVVKTNEKHETELADLAGVRLVTTIETESGRRLAESKTKMLTGGDRIKARFLYADFFEFDPTFKLWLVSNHKPNIRGTDEGIWRRIHLIPFTVTIPPDRQNKKLPEQLRDEATGILRWAIEGCMEWQRDGLQPPAAVLQAVRSYRNEMDTVGQFIEERCIVAQSLYVSSKELYVAYTTWCEENGEHPAKQIALGRSLQDRGFEPVQRTGGTRTWNGLALRSASEKSPSHEKKPAPGADSSTRRIQIPGSN